jgi:beta-glucosidase
VEVHGRLTARETATHLVGGSGLGRFALVVDGEVRAEEELDVPGGADPAAAMMRPPQFAVPVELAAGESAELVLRYSPEDPGGFEGADLAMVMVQMNVTVAGDDDAELEHTVALARGADVAVVVVATTEEVESEGFDRDSLALPGRQHELVARVADVNPRTVVVVNAGAPVLLPWAEAVPAVLLAWFGGQEFGHPLGDVLMGAAEPGGRLPVTWPASEEGLPSPTPVDGVLAYDEGLAIGYRWYELQGREPLFRFGHGLGYTTWGHAGLSVEGGGGSAVSARVRVRAGRAARSSGPCAGWSARPGSRPDPGEETEVVVPLRRRGFEHWDVDSRGWALEPGAFVLEAGPWSGALPLRAEVTPG